MKTGLASIPLIETEEGRKKMEGWLVLTPSGEKAEIVSVVSLPVSGEWSVVVVGDFGDAQPKYQTFRARELRTL